MANKTFNTRVKNKRDTAANWEAVATTFQPLDGELIIVDTSAGKTRFKVGRYDTAKGRLLYYNEIPFADEYLYNDLNESQGKIYDKLKGIDDKSIIEMTLESVFDNTKFVNYRIGLWQFPKTGFYKLNIAKRGTTATQLFLYAQKTKEDGTTPEDPFSQDNLLRISPLTGDKQVESVFVQVDYTDTDTLTVYKVQFLNVMTFPGTININTYNKTTQKWDFTSVTESSAKWANNATQVSNALTLTKGDTTTKFDGSTAQTVEIPTKTSELTNDSNFTTQTDLDNLTNNVVSYNAQENITDEQKAQARTNIGAISEADLVQPDWNQNDETAKDYIKNRICYENSVSMSATINSSNTYITNNLTVEDLNTFSSWCEGASPVNLKINNTVYTLQPGGFADGIYTLNYNNIAAIKRNIRGTYDYLIITDDFPVEKTAGLNFTLYVGEIKQIDSKFIHTLDTIAEQADDTTIPINSKAVVSVMDVLANQLLPNNFVGVRDQNFNENQKQIARNNIGIKAPFKVTFTRSYGKVSADKTAKEIKDAANNGQFVYGIFDGDSANIYTLSISNQNNIRFNRLYTETYSNMGLCYSVFYIDNPSDDFTGHYEETYCYNITAPSIRVVKVILDNGTYKFDSTGAATSYNKIFNICKTSNNNNYTNSDVFISYGGNKLYKLDQDPWSASNPLVFKRVSYDSTTSSILFETFTVNTDSTITYESNVFEQNSTQSDWNQNDTSSPAYIQNKPNIPKVDTELSTTSTNPVQNKAVKAEIDSLQASIDGKVDTTALNYGLTQVINDIAANYVKFTAEQTLTDEQKAQARDNINAPSPADAVYTATAASTDGVAYTATVSGIDSLTVGASFIMIPNKASTSKAPTLNVNGLGAKPIRRRLSSLTTSLQQGYSTNWIALNKPFTVVYDGTAWVIEGLTKTDGADVYGAVAQATADAKGNNIADTYATIAMLQSLLPKVTTITLTSNWVGDASPYYQDIALSCVTETSIVDLQPTPEQLNSWQDDGIAFTTLSGNGTVRVYVAGGKTSSAISVQVRVQEVTVI